jgi:hypothetical protein
MPLPKIELADIATSLADMFSSSSERPAAQRGSPTDQWLAKVFEDTAEVKEFQSGPPTDQWLAKVFGAHGTPQSSSVGNQWLANVFGTAPGHLSSADPRLSIILDSFTGLIRGATAMTADIITELADKLELHPAPIYDQVDEHKSIQARRDQLDVELIGRDTTNPARVFTDYVKAWPDPYPSAPLHYMRAAAYARAAARTIHYIHTQHDLLAYADAADHAAIMIPTLPQGLERFGLMSRCHSHGQKLLAALRA